MGRTLPDNELRDLLKTCRRIAVIGLSPVPARPSFGVTRYMMTNGYGIYGVRPASPKEILGRPCVERIADLKAEVDILNVFRNSEALPELVEEIAAWMEKLPKGTQKPRLLWLQEGVTNESAELRAQELGLKVVSDRCILKEHARLL